MSLDARQVMKQCDESVLAKLSFFRIRDGRPVATFLEGSELFNNNDHLEQLLRFGLIREKKEMPSFIFYRERVEDFVFVKCDAEIKACERKIEASTHAEEIARYRKHVALLTKIKQAFAFLYVNSASIPSNERYADPDRGARKAALNILSAYISKEQDRLSKLARI
ncbi:MAG: hypothetical protein Q6373_015335, partial [Candidatus Sigynarchaeota archaeon]